MKSISNSVMVTTALSAALLALPAAAQITAAEASGLNLGAANNYAVIDLGKTTLGWNSGPVAGNVLLGQGLTANLSGGNDGGLAAGGDLFFDSTAKISGSLQNPITAVAVSTSTTLAALTTAQNVSSYASGLAATQTFTTINNPTTITGNGGLNVIDVDNIQNAKLTISGNASDYFVFNVSGVMQTNEAMALAGGVEASHVLFNLTGKSGNVLQTSGGNALYGTFLATNGGEYSFSNLKLDGELINTGGNVQLVSGSAIPAGAGFKVPTAAPEVDPASAAGGLALLLGGLVVLRGRKPQKIAA